MNSNKLTHFDEAGRPRMVDVSAKADTLREATATATIFMKRDTFLRIQDRTIEKGDVFGVAQTAGVMAAKKTGDVIPLCHPLNLTSVSMEFHPRQEQSCVEVRATARLAGKTGVEMEALVAASTAALTIYDMCKAIDREMTITTVQVVKKSGGKSGTFERQAP
jgi:cyclic pyranopterin phosphate synthase